jgi:hypothetical protein
VGIASCTIETMNGRMSGLLSHPSTVAVFSGLLGALIGFLINLASGGSASHVLWIALILAVLFSLSTSAWQQYSQDKTGKQWMTMLQEMVFQTYFLTLLADKPEIAKMARQRLGEVLKTLNGAQQVSMLRFLSQSGVPARSIGDALRGGATLVGADLQRLVLCGIDLTGADLSRVNLSHANLSDADLQASSLKGGDLRGANLRGANLARSNLTGANLEGADLAGANLTEAVVVGANLSAVDLTGAMLTWAILDDADLRMAKVTEKQLQSVGSGKAMKR